MTKGHSAMVGVFASLCMACSSGPTSLPAKVTDLVYQAQGSGAVALDDVRSKARIVVNVGADSTLGQELRTLSVGCPGEFYYSADYEDKSAVSVIGCNDWLVVYKNKGMQLDIIARGHPDFEDWATPLERRM